MFQVKNKKIILPEQRCRIIEINQLLDKFFDDDWEKFSKDMNELFLDYPDILEMLQEERGKKKLTTLSPDTTPSITVFKQEFDGYDRLRKPSITVRFSTLDNVNTHFLYSWYVNNRNLHGQLVIRGNIEVPEKVATPCTIQLAEYQCDGSAYVYYAPSRVLKGKSLQLLK